MKLCFSAATYAWARYPESIHDQILACANSHTLTTAILPMSLPPGTTVMSVAFLVEPELSPENLAPLPCYLRLKGYIFIIYLLLHCFGRRPRSTSICKNQGNPTKEQDKNLACRSINLYLLAAYSTDYCSLTATY
jgi:hypothetical protein